MRKVSKKNAIDFLSQVTNILKDYKAIEVESQTSYKCYKLNTKAGELKVIIEDLDSATESSIYTVFTRFENPKEARELCECNPFSGKYNFHTSNKEECICSFSRFLHEIIA